MRRVFEKDFDSIIALRNINLTVLTVLNRSELIVEMQILVN